MRRLISLLILAISMLTLAGVGAQADVPAAAATPAVTAAPVATTAAPIVTAAPEVPRAPVVRPVPSILPTLRLIDSGMLPTLGFLLTLTDDQKAKATDLLNKSGDELKPKVAAQIRAASDYIALLGKATSSQEELTAAAQKVMAADNDLMAARIKAFVAFRGLLTAEQSKILAQELQQTASRWLPQTATVTNPAPAPAAGK